MLRRDILTSALAMQALSMAAIAPPARAGAPARRPTVRARDGVHLFHRDWGEGAPVVFASSWGLASEMWAYQVAHLSERGMRCICYDRRGHGRSDETLIGQRLSSRPNRRPGSNTANAHPAPPTR